MQNRENRFGFVGDNMTEQKRLGDIATYINGFAFKPENRGTAGLPIIRIQDLTGNAYDLGFYDGSYPKRIEINDGDVLISWSASLGVYIWNRGKALLNQHIFKVAFDKCEVNREYFVYAVRHKLKEMESKTHGATMKHIVKKDFDNTLIPFPTLSEQGKIAELLDTAATIISARQSQLQKLDELVKARFVELFGDCVLNTKRWNTRRLGDIAEVGSSKRVFVEELRESGIPFFRGTEIGALAEGKSIKPELFISENHYKELCSATGTPNMGDLLMPSICPDGRIWVVNTTEPFYFKDGRVLWVHKIDRSYNSIFLLYTLKDRIMTDYSSIASGTTFAELKIFALKECRIFDAPLELQEQFAAFVTQADKSKVAIQKALDEAQMLFDSLMQEYFG